MVVDGKKIAQELLAELKPKIAPIAKEKFFGAVLVGEDPASIHFLKQKERVAQELGLDFQLYRLPADITTDELRKEVDQLAGVKNCGGFIVQLPLPQSIHRESILNAIPEAKDVDLLSEKATNAFYANQSPIAPPSVRAVEEILQREGKNLSLCTVAVIGKGTLIGKPVGFWLEQRVAKLLAFDSKTENLHAKLAEADIIVSGTGKNNLFSAKHLKEGAFVIDFGYGRNEENKISGDFDPSGAEEKCITYTKTPGGTGPILVVKLFENFYSLNVGAPGLEPGTAKV